MKYLLLLCTVAFICSCKPDTYYDTLIYNADLYTMDSLHPVAGAIAIVDGKIAQIFDERYPLDTAFSGSVIDADGAFVIPGLIEGHGHFSGLGMSMVHLNLMSTDNWQEVIDLVEERVAISPPGTWIYGRGWHQEKWKETPLQNISGYPLHYELSEISKDYPVVLVHASGHSLYANAAAMSAAGVTVETGDPAGGHIVRDEQGAAIGVFEERAMTLIRQAMQVYVDSLSEDQKEAEWYAAIDSAQQECLRKGITSFQDAGSKMDDINKYRAMAEAGKLDLRLWAMIRHSYDEMQGQLQAYRVVGAGDHFFTCSAIKSEVDGALGAYGAWLLEPYADKAGWVGQNTTDIYEVRRIADLAVAHDMQLCVHAIGDRANRVVVDIYEGMIEQMPEGTDHRWRIEHAQHLDTVDIPRMARNHIIASMQGIHCTSDAPFVEKRLGIDRAKNGAYAWRRLLDAGVTIANGTDAPVEDVDPLQSIYASVTRRRTDGSIAFYPEQAMTRAEALYSYTMGNAYAAREDHLKGSLTVGKFADITILDHNLLTCAEEDILETQVLYTIVDGIIKYRAAHVD